MLKNFVFGLVAMLAVSCAQTKGDNSNASASVNFNANVAKNMNTPQSNTTAAEASEASDAAEPAKQEAN